MGRSFRSAVWSDSKVIGSFGGPVERSTSTRDLNHIASRVERKLGHVQAGVDPVTQHHVAEMVDRLVGEFGDRFERAQIEELMADSLGQLAGPAQVPDFLPVLAYRFTRERLGAIARTRARASTSSSSA
jgi:hypothetical protein